MSKTVLSEAIRDIVRLRGGYCCEYCKSQDKFSPVHFTIDHILPLIEGGTNDLENLAYACMLCNRFKWKSVLAFDPVTNTMVSIYNPRLDLWKDHFQWGEAYLSIIGISPIGRATVAALQLNREKLVSYRRSMVEIGHHPPI